MRLLGFWYFWVYVFLLFRVLGFMVFRVVGFRPQSCHLSCSCICAPAELPGPVFRQVFDKECIYIYIYIYIYTYYTGAH